MNLRRTRAVARKEFLHLLRDARSLFMALAIPLIMLLLFGYALSLDVDRIPALIYDADQTPQSRDLAERFRASRYFEITAEVRDADQVNREIDRGRSLLALVILPGFADDVLSGGAAPVQLIVDGSDSNTASIARGYAEGLLRGYAVELRTAGVSRRGAARLPSPLEPAVRVWYNSELKSRNYIVPGLIAVILMIIAALLTSLTIAREWESGTMEQLLSTPLRASELVLGKMAAFFAVGIVDMSVAILVGVLVFDVPLRGNPVLLFSTGCVFLFGALCWGILLSALTRSQLMAYQAGMLTSFLPAFLLSGFVYALENMPAPVQAVSYLVPARYFVTLVKGIFLKGVGLELLWWELALLVAYAVLVFALATRRLNQKLA